LASSSRLCRDSYAVIALCGLLNLTEEEKEEEEGEEEEEEEEEEEKEEEDFTIFRPVECREL
jgi:ribosomal protein L12E/L44/L45/RPP1/RPP2